jgi:L-rhamnose mutarotase
MKRYAQVLGMPPENLAEYRRLHAAVWPEVLATIRSCNIRNYSIYHHDGLLFAYFEYHGDDFAADMAKMAADPKTQEWWAICEPLQRQLPTAVPGQWWSDAEEVFHTE